jgi:hypothetical protein
MPQSVDVFLPSRGPLSEVLYVRTAMYVHLLRCSIGHVEFVLSSVPLSGRRGGGDPRRCKCR